MAKKEWDQHPVGGTSVFPVTGFRIGTALNGTAGVVRIEYGTEPSLTKRKAQQFLLTAKQVRALSERLARLADRLGETGSGAGPSDPAD